MILYVYINDAEITTLLAPILGQYGIKPSDF